MHRVGKESISKLHHLQHKNIHIPAPFSLVTSCVLRHLAAPIFLRFFRKERRKSMVANCLGFLAKHFK